MSALVAGIALLDGVLPALQGFSGTTALIGGAIALGIRHGIDWDHIAAITDITSTSAAAPSPQEERLLQEPSVMLTDESHHLLVARPMEAVGAGVGSGASAPVPHEHTSGVRHYLGERRRPFLLGTLYALGHGAVVTLLGVIAIVASGFLPDWVDVVMGRIVGVTLLFLAGYLFYSLFRYLRGGTFELRSRWMLVFDGTRAGYRLLMTKIRRRTQHVHAHEHEHEHGPRTYGARSAFGIGLIHGVGAETGTQALVIASAVGAADRTAGIIALAAFVVGLLISNSFVTIATTAGFVSTQKRQWVYVAAGLFAAVFSTILGVVFILGADATLPDLGRLFGG